MRSAGANQQILESPTALAAARQAFRFATGPTGLKLNWQSTRMSFLRLAWRCVFCSFLVLLAASFGARGAHAEKLDLPPGAAATLDKIYAFDLEAAITDSRQIQHEHPDHPLGYLLEAEARWWRIWCLAAEFKYGMVDARHRQKLPADQPYLALSATALSISESQLKQNETAEMHFYAGMAGALAARLYGLRGENRATARAGVRAREHFLRAVQLDPSFADADFGLGLYNYYVDTLSGIIKFLSFFMGIPGGNKQEGIRQLDRAIQDGVLTPPEARFYLALDLHRFDQQYERALTVIGPLVERFPSNPLFQLARGDLYAKLARRDQALACYRIATSLPVQDADCRARIQALVHASLLALVGAQDAAAIR